jgi:hypothetical protein
MIDKNKTQHAALIFWAEIVQVYSIPGSCYSTVFQIETERKSGFQIAVTINLCARQIRWIGNMKVLIK